MIRLDQESNVKVSSHCSRLQHRRLAQEHHHPRLKQWISAPFRSLFQHLLLVAHVIVLIALTALAIFKSKGSRQYVNSFCSCVFNMSFDMWRWYYPKVRSSMQCRVKSIRKVVSNHCVWQKVLPSFKLEPITSSKQLDLSSTKHWTYMDIWHILAYQLAKNYNISAWIELDVGFTARLSPWYPRVFATSKTMAFASTNACAELSAWKCRSQALKFDPGQALNDWFLLTFDKSTQTKSTKQDWHTPTDLVSHWRMPRQKISH